MQDVVAWTREMRAKQPPTQQTQPAATEIPPPRNFRGVSVSHHGAENGATTPPETADGLREQGNSAFQAGNFQEAEMLYTRSLDMSTSAAAYANRAMARLKLKRWAAAEQDCCQALELNPHYVKALQRRGTARREQGRLFDAACDFDCVARLEPSSKVALKERADALAAYERQAGKPLQRAQEVSVPVRPLVQPHAEPTVPVLSRTVSPVKGHGTIVDVHGSGESWETVRDALAETAMPLHVMTPRTPPHSVSQLSDTTGNGMEATAAAALAVLASQPISAPRTGIEFEAAWKRANDNPDMQLRLLSLVPPESLPKLVKESLTAAVLFAVARSALALLMPQNASRAVAYLRSLPLVPRFSTALMLMAGKDKAALAAAWDEAVGPRWDASQEGEDAREELRRLRETSYPGV